MTTEPDSASVQTFQIYAGEDDVAAVYKPFDSSSPLTVTINNNNNGSNQTVSPKSRPQPVPERVVELPCRMLTNAEYSEALEYFKSHRGSHYIRETMTANEEFHHKISNFIVEQNMVKELSISQSGNFIAQCIPGDNYKMDTAFCAQMNKHLEELVFDKYGCRVVQAVIQKVHPELVKQIVHKMEGFQLRVCLDKSGTHVIQCLLLHHPHRVYEQFFHSFTNQHNLRIVMEDKFGCRIIQKCMEALSREISVNYVPSILNHLMVPLLHDAERYVSNEFANYVIQFIIIHPAFRRQRDYIIDNVLMHNLLRLSQGKFSSHVVEAALGSACQIRLERMCSELFHDYHVGRNGKIPLEILLFDQFGNYVVQKLLTIAIEVSNGQRKGNPSWMTILQGVVVRNEIRLKRYSSGKKILDILAEHQASIHTHPVRMAYAPPVLSRQMGNRQNYYFR